MFILILNTDFFFTGELWKKRKLEKSSVAEANLKPKLTIQPITIPDPTRKDPPHMAFTFIYGPPTYQFKEDIKSWNQGKRAKFLPALKVKQFLEEYRCDINGTEEFKQYLSDFISVNICVLHINFFVVSYTF